MSSNRFKRRRQPPVAPVAMAAEDATSRCKHAPHSHASPPRPRIASLPRRGFACEWGSSSPPASRDRTNIHPMHRCCMRRGHLVNEREAEASGSPPPPAPTKTPARVFAERPHVLVPIRPIEQVCRLHKHFCRRPCIQTVARSRVCAGEVAPSLAVDARHVLHVQQYSVRLRDELSALPCVEK